ncbi:MAG: hypothetical protein ABIC82_05795 [bacterium]
MSSQEKIPQEQNSGEEVVKTQLEEDLDTTDFDEKTKNIIKDNLNTPSELFGGATNIVQPILMGISFGDEDILKGILQKQGTLPEYEEYAKQELSKTLKEDQRAIEFIINHSNGDNVKELNRLIGELNILLAKTILDEDKIKEKCGEVRILITGGEVQSSFKDLNKQLEQQREEKKTQ